MGKTAVMATERVVEALRDLPMIAILRGLPLDDAETVVEVLAARGVRLAEVPLNSPDPFATISRLQQRYGDAIILGAGTVTTVEDVERLAATGAPLCVSPHTDPRVIAAAIAHGLTPIPGFQTATEAFTAIAAGARILKFFPAAGQAQHIRALRAVLPRDIMIVAVGGVTPECVPTFRASGCDAFGIGSDLYRPGKPSAEIAAAADTWMKALES
jgi:Entner-Doudoroff aldolase